MHYEEDDFLLLSGIQHFAFCRRQWALIHVENIWSDNERTASGQLMHDRAHNPFLTEKRGDLIVVRDMPVASRRMGVAGKCDVVEFLRNDTNGVSLSVWDGLWLPCPIEYKRGHPKVTDIDRLQLCAQAICLEEMLCCPPINEAYLFYGETKRREPVMLTPELRNSVESMFEEMRGYYNRLYTPRVKNTKACKNCSLKDICLPKLPQKGLVATYINNALSEDNL
ncbi:MAG: CRISPR-associated protein Cas4 [Oscillospiraceae bacterium]|nr:CRISPR-associated protein Cas4 [Oscillospiraceae bacterium]